jgi:chromosome segregation ATPase
MDGFATKDAAYNAHSFHLLDVIADLEREADVLVEVATARDIAEREVKGLYADLDARSAMLAATQEELRGQRELERHRRAQRDAHDAQLELADRKLAAAQRERDAANAQRDAEQNRIDAVARATREAMHAADDETGDRQQILEDLLDALTDALDIEPAGDDMTLSAADAIRRARAEGRRSSSVWPIRDV